MANKGKLKGRLGVDGYAPSAIQYDNKDINDGDGEEPAAQRPKTGNTAANAANIDEYITKVSSYRAGGDGGKSLKVLKLLVGNAADNPAEEKFKKINMETNAYKNKVKRKKVITCNARWKERKSIVTDTSTVRRANVTCFYLIS